MSGVVFGCLPKHPSPKEKRPAAMTVLNTNILKAQFYSVAGRNPFTGAIKYGLAPIANWGVHGIGKTAVATKLAIELDFDFVYALVPSQMGDAGDVGGIPFLDASGEFFSRRPQEWAVKANKAKRALIIIDEFGDCPEPMQAALQALINERKAGDYELGGHVRFLILGNPPSISTNPHELGMPVANRMGHISLDYGAEDRQAWREWGNACGVLDAPKPRIDGDAEEKRVLNRFESDWAWAWGQIDGYVHSIGTNLQIPEQGSPDASRAHMTPRTMTFAALALAAARAHGLSEVDTDAWIAAYIGQAATAEFAAWRREADLPTAEDVLGGKVEWSHDPTRPDITLAVMGSCASLVRSSKNKDYAKAFWALAVEHVDTAPDLIYVAAKTARVVRIKDPNRKNVMAELFDMTEAVEAA